MASVLQTPQAQTARRSNLGTVKLFAGGAVILAVIGYVMFSSFQANTIYYYHLGEVSAQRSSLMGQTIRINGPLDKDSIQVDSKNLVLTFNLKDGELVQPVVYRGVVPDTLST